MKKLLAMIPLMLLNQSFAHGADCGMLQAAESAMIAARAKFYISVLLEKKDLHDLRGAAFWNNETAKARTLKDFEEQLSGDQLNALAKAGCAPWQGAAFNKSVEMVVGQSVVNILDSSTTIEQAAEKLSRLGRSKSLAAIPQEFRTSVRK
jgi:hypothetical protein